MEEEGGTRDGLRGLQVVVQALETLLLELLLYFLLLFLADDAVGRFGSSFQPSKPDVCSA